MMESLILKLNDQESIVVFAKVPINQVCSLEQILVTFCGLSNQYVLYDQDIDDALWKLMITLK